MTTALLTHADCLKHVTPPGHPECIDRLDAILAALEGKNLQRIDAPLAKSEDILLAHPQSHIDVIEQELPETGIKPIDGDTWMSPESLNAALRAAGGAVKAVDMVMAGDVLNAFVACRPPGHHAEYEIPMGFCLFGTVAIAAKHALERHGLSRVAVVDFDVHHGNGTQDLLQDEARVFFASSHQMPLFPGTGGAHETGKHGNVLNVPLRDGMGSTEFRQVWGQEILPAVAAFEPEFILVSAGFDAHAADPLASLRLTEADFAWVTSAICDLAGESCQGRVVSSLEGGYDLQALAASAAAHVDALMAREG
ncbi:Histone deacetylase-like amidohydrolase [Roseovarius albus]|uniref:Histone deacetylase-like amidohydrolase n=1 Tax=Roseovarius albus TaxID=1247867 RepID=A0A1X6ZJT0_9RHOB|nr:histone deacetylase family protein [Roseovarius albus]SLN53156.1 Histone deacetylase-like amidohydrolase [Roseovarius albus]